MEFRGKGAKHGQASWSSTQYGLRAPPGITRSHRWGPEVLPRGYFKGLGKQGRTGYPPFPQQSLFDIAHEGVASWILHLEHRLYCCEVCDSMSVDARRWIYDTNAQTQRKIRRLENATDTLLQAVGILQTAQGKTPIPRNLDAYGIPDNQ